MANDWRLEMYNSRQIPTIRRRITMAKARLAQVGAFVISIVIAMGMGVLGPELAAADQRKPLDELIIKAPCGFSAQRVAWDPVSRTAYGWSRGSDTSVIVGRFHVPDQSVRIEGLDAKALRAPKFTGEGLPAFLSAYHFYGLNPEAPMLYQAGWLAGGAGCGAWDPERKIIHLIGWNGHCLPSVGDPWAICEYSPDSGAIKGSRAFTFNAENAGAVWLPRQKRVCIVGGLYWYVSERKGKYVECRHGVTTYDPETQTLARGGQLAHPVGSAATVYSPDDGMVYVFGGISKVVVFSNAPTVSVRTKVIQVYDPETGLTRQLKAKLPVALSDMASCWDTKRHVIWLFAGRSQELYYEAYGKQREAILRFDPKTEKIDTMHQYVPKTKGNPWGNWEAVYDEASDTVYLLAAYERILRFQPE
ncbi:MAG: hypothetical protein KKI08_07200 [Armatimonadetes bacterium]|nr:hypothetical protein [Armatimonadota bacterium]